MKQPTNISQKIRSAAYHTLYTVLAGRDLGRLLIQAKRIIDRPDVKVVSFDIFDTCLARLSYRPEDIFRLAFQDNDPIIFQERCRAESELKKAGIPYPTFEEIWQYLGEKCHLSEQLTRQLSQKEIQLEKHLVSARKPLLDLYGYAVSSGKRVIAVSDMYLDSRTLRDMLSQAGYRDPDRIYVSCECQGSKSDGALYDYVLDQEAVTSPCQLFHIGNGFISDCWRARGRRIRHLCIPSPFQRFQYSAIDARRYIEGHLASVQERCLFGFLLNACEEDGGLTYRRAGLDLRLFTKAIVFPLLFRIDEFIIENEEIQKNYREVYFVSRDGWLPMKGYQMMRDHYGKGLPAVYLYGSRQLCKKSDDEARNRRIQEYYRDTVKLKEGRAVIYDIGYSGSVAGISCYFDTPCIIDKIYLWQKGANKTLDNKTGARTYVLDDRIQSNLRTFLEAVFNNPEEGSAVDITKEGNTYLPVSYPSAADSSSKMVVNEIHALALSLLASYIPYKSIAGIPVLSDSSSITDLVHHYFGGRLSSSASCLKDITYDDPLTRTRRQFSLDRYIRKESWNDCNVISALKSSMFKLFQIRRSERI